MMMTHPSHPEHMTHPSHPDQNSYVFVRVCIVVPQLVLAPILMQEQYWAQDLPDY
jgi:hypothetical protein